MDRLMLEAAAAEAIWCSKCGIPLRKEQTVIIELRDGGQVLRKWQICCGCFDADLKGALSSCSVAFTAFEWAAAVSVTDGRQAFAGGATQNQSPQKPSTIGPPEGPSGGGS